MNSKILIEKAVKAMESSYSPYSGFRVGAALLTKSGRVYTGCNVENASYSPTCCAERVAFFNAISNGEKEFTAIAVVGGKDGRIASFCSPCGVCRQVMAEFCDKDFMVILFDGKLTKAHTLEKLLPESFSL